VRPLVQACLCCDYEKHSASLLDGDTFEQKQKALDCIVLYPGFSRFKFGRLAGVVLLGRRYFQGSLAWPVLRRFS